MVKNRFELIAKLPEISRGSIEMIANEDKVSMWFIDYMGPSNSIEARTVVLDDGKAEQLKSFMVRVIPTCYITEDDIKCSMKKNGISASEVMHSVIPTCGRIMAGDFGEILTLFFLGSECDKKINKILKWRFKEGKNKPSSYSDVILIYKEYENVASENDFVICAESKVKSTDKKKLNPIENSIERSKKDKTTSLALTLNWLEDKAITDKTETIDLNLIKRFTKEPLDKSFSKKFRAVSIIDLEFLNDELVKKMTNPIPTQSDEFEVIVLGIKDLKSFYEMSLERAKKEVNCD